MPNEILKWLILGVEEDISYEIPHKYKDFTDWYFIIKSRKVSVRKRIPREQIGNEKKRFNAYRKLNRFAKTKKDKQTLDNRINEKYEHLANFYDYLSNEVLSVLEIWLSKKEKYNNTNTKIGWIEYPMKMAELSEKYYYKNPEGAIKLIEENADTIKIQALRFKNRAKYYSKKVPKENG